MELASTVGVAYCCSLSGFSVCCEAIQTEFASSPTADSRLSQCSYTYWSPTLWLLSIFSRRGSYSPFVCCEWCFPLRVGQIAAFLQTGHVVSLGIVGASGADFASVQQFSHYLHSQRDKLWEKYGTRAAGIE